MKLQYKTANLEMVLEIAGKFNIIVGDSGSGKTLLAVMANTFRQLYEDDIPGATIPKPVVSSLVHFEQYIPVWHDAVFIIDEGFKSEDLRKWVPLMRASDNYYIFITRDGLSEIPYGLSNVFHVNGDMRRLYMTPAYVSDYLLTRHPMPLVIVEDQGAGFDVVRQICSNTCSVVHADGKSKLSAKVESFAEKSLVIFDVCGIGRDLNALLLLRDRDRCLLFDSLSFEHEVLSRVFPGYYKPFTEDYWRYASSEEDYYVEQLSTLLNRVFDVSYSKTASWLVTLLEKGSACFHKKPLKLLDAGGHLKACYPELRENHSKVE